MDKESVRHAYYMSIAVAARGRDNKRGRVPPNTYGANCRGSKIGAVLVRENRVISTGYNGTPSGFKNCSDGGCVRCASDDFEPGTGLDRCICVHTEQNALLTAAKFGNRVDGSTLYTTLSPCFGCLKEALQAGVRKIVYGELYGADYTDELQAQYDELSTHLDEFIVFPAS